MNPVGFIPLAVGCFAFIGAVICFRRAADPMAMLERRKSRDGVDYTRMISDPDKYARRMAQISTFSGAYLIIVGIILCGLAIFMSGTSHGGQRGNGSAGLQMDRDEQAYIEAQRAERMKHIFDVQPAETRPAP